MKNLCNRLVIVVLTTVLILSLFIPALAAPTTFSDVPSNARYAQDVADDQRYGIINGVGNDKFLPAGNLSFAQAITMAARTYAYLRGEAVPQSNDSVWYKPYYDYAMEKGVIIEEMLPSDLDLSCDRFTMAKMFFEIIADRDNQILNDIEKIPDIEDGNRSFPVYSLYRFGRV